MRKILALLLLLGMATWAKGQDLYVTGSVSTNHAFGENMRFGDIFTDIPGFDVGVGYNFSRIAGVRLSGGYHKHAGRAPHELWAAHPELSKKYIVNTAGVYADAMLNLTALFGTPKPYRTDAFYFVAGGGLLFVTGFSDNVREKVWKDNYMVYPTNRFVPALHAGFAGSIKLTSHLDLALEAKINLASDRYNGHTRDEVLVDAFMDFSVGLSYYFFRPRMEKVNMIDDSNMHRIEEVIVRDELKYGNRMQTGVSFLFDISEVDYSQRSNMKAIADYLIAHPDENAIIHAYADREAKTDFDKDHNAKLAKERAQEVCAKLVSNYNISEERLSIETHSQPLEGVKPMGNMMRAVEIEIVK